MSRSKGFFTVAWEHLHLPGLNTSQIMLLCRMSSFGVFYEAPANTASFLNYSPKTVQSAKQVLLKAGYIFEIENTGRGKKYLVRADLRQRPLSDKDLKLIEKIKKQAAEKGTPLNIPAHFLDAKVAKEKFPIYGEEPQDLSDTHTETEPQVLQPSTTEKTQQRYKKTKDVYTSEQRWSKKHPDLVPLAEKALAYLEAQGIPIFDYSEFRRGLTLVANTLRSDIFPEQHIHVIEQYLDYIQSDYYYDQLSHIQYVPRVITQEDLWRKFNSIRDFARNPDRHYDPSKTLTPE